MHAMLLFGDEPADAVQVLARLGEDLQLCVVHGDECRLDVRVERTEVEALPHGRCGLGVADDGVDAVAVQCGNCRRLGAPLVELVENVVRRLACRELRRGQSAAVAAQERKRPPDELFGPVAGGLYARPGVVSERAEPLEPQPESVGDSRRDGVQHVWCPRFDCSCCCWWIVGGFYARHKAEQTAGAGLRWTPEQLGRGGRTTILLCVHDGCVTGGNYAERINVAYVPRRNPSQQA